MNNEEHALIFKPEVNYRMSREVVFVPWGATVKLDDDRVITGPYFLMGDIKVADDRRLG